MQRIVSAPRIYSVLEVLAKLIDGGRNKASTEFSISFLQTLLIDEPKVVSKLRNLIDALAKLTTKPGYPESLRQLIEMIKNPVALSASNAGKEDKLRLSRDNKGPSLLVGNREELNIVDSAKPDPAGFLASEWAAQGVYGDNCSYMYQGYGYTPYGAYASPNSSSPMFQHDGQLYGLQQYQYPCSYYNSPTSADVFAPNKNQCCTTGNVNCG
ncbi:hypothetical protein KIW84_054837 [Lathyrus oleraceus]|uniref:CCR4-NOT transcription complex subunit 1-like NOT1 connector domain-containing protein n=1 Tax=Pisum sativum TaxID=3888 RepID=A0A9D5AJ08_PEA|nr:hypothetical protein KIW84_054837 [Pisum sativum]